MIDGKKLRAYVNQYQEYADQRDQAAADQKQLLEDAAEDGFDPKVLRLLLRELKADEAHAVRMLREAQLAEYRNAWLDFGTTPLGASAKPTVVQSDGVLHISGDLENDPALKLMVNDLVRG